MLVPKTIFVLKKKIMKKKMCDPKYILICLFVCPYMFLPRETVKSFQKIFRPNKYFIPTNILSNKYFIKEIFRPRNISIFHPKIFLCYRQSKCSIAAWSDVPPLPPQHVLLEVLEQLESLGVAGDELYYGVMWEGYGQGKIWILNHSLIAHFHFQKFLPLLTCAWCSSCPSTSTRSPPGLPWNRHLVLLPSLTCQLVRSPYLCNCIEIN